MEKAKYGLKLFALIMFIYQSFVALKGFNDSPTAVQTLRDRWGDDYKPRWDICFIRELLFSWTNVLGLENTVSLKG